MGTRQSISAIVSGSTRWLGLLGAVPLSNCSAEQAVVWEGDPGERAEPGRVGTGPPGLKESTGPPWRSEGASEGIEKAA